MPCNNCASRGVYCHGYGPKPAWKDRGAREQEEARRLRFQSGRCRGSSTDFGVEDMISSEPGQLLENTDSINRAGDAASLRSLCLDDIPSPPSSTAGLGEFDLFLSSEFLSMSPATDASLNLSTAITPCPPIEINQSNNDLVHDGIFLPLSPLETSVGLPESGTECERVSQDLLLFRHEGNVHGQGPESERKFELLMQFIVETCIGQARTRPTSTRMLTMSWLLLLLSRSSTFYHASVSISAYQSYLDPSRDSEERSIAFGDYEEHRELALRQFGVLQKLTMPQSASLSKLGERVICSLLIAKLEVRPQSSATNYDPKFIRTRIRLTF